MRGACAGCGCGAAFRQLPCLAIQCALLPPGGSAPLGGAPPTPPCLPRPHSRPPTLVLAPPPGQVLVIDEVSRVSAEFFHLLESMCRQIRGLDAPFGGLQLVLSGDFFQ